MRVLFYNRDHSLWPGGDAVQLTNTMLALQSCGVTTQYRSTLPPLDELKTFDLVHVFHINFEWSRDIIQQCLIEQVPYVISSIFYPNQFAIPFEEMKGYLDAASAVIALSEAEKQEMIDLTKCSGENIVVIPNGVKGGVGRLYTAPSPRAITLARVIPSKGILYAAKACQALGIPFVYAGQIGDEKYHQEILQTGAVYLGLLDENQVHAALMQSTLYICSSESERQSLGVLEAAAHGLPIVDSIYNRGASFLPSSVIVDPKDSQALQDAINKQRLVGYNDDEVPTWHDVAQDILHLYESKTSR